MYAHIRNGPFKNLNLNRVAVLLEELGWQTGKFLPKDTQKLGIHELFSTQPSFMRSGLAAKIANTIQKIFIEQGCTQEAGYCVATGTWKMSLRYGHRTIYSLPYDQYLEDGKPVFENLYDKATAANTTLFDYKRDKFGRRS
uniref:N-acetyltransferase domain-containing protein n=1 Tax=Panagrolaimus davidi TaxID=227884 RepID=A0A914QW00_9BILA